MGVSKLSKEEIKTENLFDELKPVSNNMKKKVEKLIETSRKSRPISLRINQKDLERLKEKANKNGLPYQTMINVIIHKYVSNSYLDKEEIDKFLKLKNCTNSLDLRMNHCMEIEKEKDPPV